MAVLVLQLLNSVVQRRQKVIGDPGELFARRRQIKTTRFALKQLEIPKLLNMAYLMADRTLRHVQLFGSLGKTEVSGRRRKGAQRSNRWHMDHQNLQAVGMYA